MKVKNLLSAMLTAGMALLALGVFMTSRALAGQYVFSVIPQKPPITTHTIWAPFLDKLSEETGQEFKLKVYSRIADFEDDLRSGVPDFVFMNPLESALRNVRDKYVPLVRNATKVSGLLITRADSPARNIMELAGTDIAFVGAKNLCSISIRDRLIKGSSGEPIDFSPIYVGSTGNVIKYVLIGKATAGAVLDVGYYAESEEVRAQLRILDRTIEIPPHPISAHKRIPVDLQQAVASMVLKMAGEAESAEMLKSIGMPQPVKADYKGDYSVFESVDTEALGQE